LIRRGELLLFATLLVLDQGTKQAVLAAFANGGVLPVTPFLNLVLVWNPGVSFGMLAGLGDAQPGLLAAVTVAIVALLFVWLRREERRWPRTALVLVLAGAIGNLSDRVRFGAVVDFLDFHWAGYHWPAFNVADSAIVIGAGLLLLDGLVPRRTPASQAGGER
jgi:signal peptidase II